MSISQHLTAAALAALVGLSGIACGGRTQGSSASSGPAHRKHGAGGDAGKKRNKKKRSKPSELAVSADPRACQGGPSAPAADAAYVSDPRATFESTSYGYVLVQELDAFPGYGADDEAADILYPGDVGSWTFSVPRDAIVSATVVVSMVADDGSDDPSRYSFDLWTGECPVGSRGSLPHGSPAGAPFDNWRSLGYEATPTAGAPFVVTIRNTSAGSGADWIAIDWIELRVTTASPVAG